MNIWNKEKYYKYAKEIFTCDSPTGYTIEVIKLIENHLKEWGYNYNNTGKELSQNGMDIYKKLMNSREESLSNKLADGKQNPVGVIAILNKHYGWNMPGVTRETSRTQALPASELPKLGATAAKIKEID